MPLQVRQLSSEVSRVFPKHTQRSAGASGSAPVVTAVGDILQVEGALKTHAPES